jgi:phosphoserine phosphatase RsbU/P
MAISPSHEGGNTPARVDRQTRPAVRLDRQNPYLRLDCVNIFVRDLNRSLDFYVNQLGFAQALDLPLQSGERLVAVAPPDGTAVLRLVAPPPDSQAHDLIGRYTQIVFLTEDVVAKFREWRQRGVRFRYTPRLRRIRYDPSAAGEDAWRETAPVWGGVFTRFEDLDGNSFLLVGFDEVSRQLEQQRQAVAEKLEAERLAVQELEIAREVQARLFPQTQPASDTLDYAGTCMQARQVGGDYYDFLELGNGRLGLVLGDVAGKGIAAALLMANLQANLRGQCAIAQAEPERFLASVNRLFCENSTESAYATLFFAAYDSTTSRLRYANCGHLPPILARADGRLDRLESTCTVVGLFPDWECGVEECHLAPGDTLVLYTDGVTESFDDQGDQFGERRLIDTIGRHRECAPQAMLEAIVGEVRRFSPAEQFDDITVIVARRNG